MNDANRELKTQLQMISETIKLLEQKVNLCMSAVGVTDTLEKMNTKSNSFARGLSFPAVMRFVSECGHKALTISYCPHPDYPDKLILGVSDSAGEAQFNKKVGVRLAALRRSSPEPTAIISVMDGFSTNSVTKKIFVDMLRFISKKEPTYENLSKLFRPMISSK
jgi:hypothetical protein